MECNKCEWKGGLIFYCYNQCFGTSSEIKKRLKYWVSLWKKGYFHTLLDDLIFYIIGHTAANKLTPDEITAKLDPAIKQIEKAAQ